MHADSSIRQFLNWTRTIRSNYDSVQDQGAIQSLRRFLITLWFFVPLECLLALWFGLYRAPEYAAAGLMVHANEVGPVRTRQRALLWTVALVISSAMLVVTGVGGLWTGVTAGLLGAIFLFRAAKGLRADADDAWARGLFRYSLVYLTVLFTVMAVEKLLT